MRGAALSYVRRSTRTLLRQIFSSFGTPCPSMRIPKLSAGDVSCKPRPNCRVADSGSMVITRSGRYRFSPAAEANRSASEPGATTAAGSATCTQSRPSAKPMASSGSLLPALSIARAVCPVRSTRSSSGSGGSAKDGTSRSTPRRAGKGFSVSCHTPSRTSSACAFSGITSISRSFRIRQF